MLRELTIDGQRIADDTDCYVIAEIGHNHQGDLDKARQLFLRAKECGVHAVKLQKRDNRSLYTTAMYDRPYEHENSFGRTYGEHREVLEFGRERIPGIAGIRATARPHVLRDGFRRAERGLPRQARRAGIQDRLG